MVCSLALPKQLTIKRFHLLVLVGIWLHSKQSTNISYNFQLKWQAVKCINGMVTQHELEMVIEKCSFLLSHLSGWFDKHLRFWRQRNLKALKSQIQAYQQKRTSNKIIFNTMQKFHVPEISRVSKNSRFHSYYNLMSSPPLPPAFHYFQQFQASNINNNKLLNLL